MSLILKYDKSGKNQFLYCPFNGCNQKFTNLESALIHYKVIKS